MQNTFPIVIKAAKSNQISQITENCSSPLNTSPFYHHKKRGKQKQKLFSCDTGNIFYTPDWLVGFFFSFLFHFLFNPSNPINQHFFKGNYFKRTTFLIAWIEATFLPKIVNTDLKPFKA